MISKLIVKFCNYKIKIAFPFLLQTFQTYMYFLQDYQARISVFQQWNHVSQESYMYMSNTFKYVGGFLIKRFLLLSKRHLLLRAIEISFSILDLCLIIWLQLLISNNEKISDENCCELRFLESRHVNTCIMKMISTIQC